MKFVFEKLLEKDYIFLNFLKCEDVQLSGLRRLIRSPLVVVVKAFKETIKRTLNEAVIFSDQIDNTTEPYIISVGVTQSPIDWCGPDKYNQGFNTSTPERKSIFHHLTNEYLRDMQNGQAFLMIDQSHEGYQEEWLWSWFHNCCEEFKINPKQIIYVTGNLDSEMQYANWANTYFKSDRMLVVPYVHFEFVIGSNVEPKVKSVESQNRFFPTYNDHLTFNKTKIYNCLQKRIRSHRIWFFNKLVKEDLLDCGINSMNDFRHIDTCFNGEWMLSEEYDHIRSLNILPLIPLENPVTDVNDKFKSGDSGEYLLMFNQQTMLESWLTVVSEASFNDGDTTCFISEKTFKPIACCHPFIIYGNKGSLQHLRNMGYKTFSPFIDETYDTLSTWDRMEAIIIELKRIKNMSDNERREWYISMKDILEHNKKVLINNSSSFPLAITTIANYVQTTSNRN